MTKAEIDTQVTTAKQYPRDLANVKEEATQMVPMDQAMASECIYALKRKDADGERIIQGPSARFAEVLASCWGNCRCAARPVGDDGKAVTSQGIFVDMQKNVVVQYESSRRVTYKNGRRYSDDLVNQTINAASAISLRNAVLKGIPKAFWKPIFEAAQTAAIGKAESHTQRRDAMLDHFGKMGVSHDQVLTALGKEAGGVGAITPEDVVTMRGIAATIRDGERDIDEVFPPATRTHNEPATDDVKEKWILEFGRLLAECKTLTQVADCWTKFEGGCPDVEAAKEIVEARKAAIRSARGEHSNEQTE